MITHSNNSHKLHGRPTSKHIADHQTKLHQPARSQVSSVVSGVSVLCLEHPVSARIRQLRAMTSLVRTRRTKSARPRCRGRRSFSTATISRHPHAGAHGPLWPGTRVRGKCREWRRSGSKRPWSGGTGGGPASCEISTPVTGRRRRRMGVDMGG